MFVETRTVFDALPLGVLFLVILTGVLLSIEAGYRLGRLRGSKSDAEKTAPVGSMVGTTLGLLAFLLAFTFGLAASRFDGRKALVLEEANAIGTTWLRAGMLPERQAEIRGLLREYVDVRLEAVQTGDAAGGVRRSEGLQGQIWAHATAVATAHPDSIIVGLFVQSLNETIDLHAKRIAAGLRNRIPQIVWFTLFGIAALSLAAMGYHAGLVGPTRSFAVLVVAFAFSAVMVLIADLDRPQQGTLRVSQQALIDLRQSMGQ
jgi:hypothetical protein